MAAGKLLSYFSLYLSSAYCVNFNLVPQKWVDKTSSCLTEEEIREVEKSMNIPVPLLTKQNYLGWSFDMRVFLQYHGLLTVVELEQGLIPTTKKADFKIKDKKALDFIHQGVLIDEIFDKIADATTSKQAWDNTLKHLERMIPNMVSPKLKQPNDPDKLARYNKALAYLSAPQCSRTLIYEPHLVTLTNNNKTATATKRPPISKKVTPKKISNKLLNNVKILTATGMLDGVAVRYISKTKKSFVERFKDLPISAVVNTAINAYEFERHAGNKTSHPNNHIHFENRNSVHMVVTELNSTPDSNLYDALQTLTASSIDHEAFSAWKGSF